MCSVWSGSSVRVTMLTVVTTPRPALSPAPAHNAASQHQYPAVACLHSSLADVCSYFCPSRHFYWDLEEYFAPSLLYLEQARPCIPSPLGRAPPRITKGGKVGRPGPDHCSNMQSIKCPILHFIFIAPRIKFQETYYGWFNSNIIYTKGWINIFLRNKAKINGDSAHHTWVTLPCFPAAATAPLQQGCK